MGQQRFSHFEAKTQASHSSSLFPVDSAWEQDEMSGSWQIVPPIITSGHLPIVERTSTPRIKPLAEQAPAEETAVKLIPGELVRQYNRAAGWQKGVRPGLPPAGHPSQWDRWESQVPLSVPEKKKRVKKPLPPLIQRCYAGLTDSVVVLLAPLFTVAFLARNPFTAFLVGVIAAFAVGLVRTFLALVKSVRGGNSVLRRSLPGYFALFFGLLQTLPYLLPTIQLALYTNALVIALQLIVLIVIASLFNISSPKA